MGWENFLRPGDDPTDDFTQHRAQMRHYDDYMGRVEAAGITGSFSTGFSYGSGHGGSSNNGPSAVSVAGPSSYSEVAGGDRYAFRVSNNPDKSDVDGSFDNMDLTQVMNPEVTAIKAGSLTWEGNPGWSDAEEVEMMYADIGSNIYGVAKLLLGDLPYNAGRLADHYGWTDNARWQELRGEPRRHVQVEKPTFTWEQWLDNSIATSLGQPRPAYHGF